MQPDQNHRAINSANFHQRRCSADLRHNGYERHDGSSPLRFGPAAPADDVKDSVERLAAKCDELERRCNKLQANQMMMDRMAAGVENPFRERESRIAMLEAMEREDRRRFGSRERERPLRSNSRDPTVAN